MPRQLVLSATERQNLLALPDTSDELIRRYTLTETDLAIIRKHRGATNRLGFAIQLCYLRFPGIVLGVDEPPSPALLRLIAEQLKISVSCWADYGQRAETRREHLLELQKTFGFKALTTSHYQQAVEALVELAMQTDKGIVLAESLVEDLRRQSIILSAMYAIERICAEAITLANRRIYTTLADPLSTDQRQPKDIQTLAQYWKACIARLDTDDDQQVAYDIVGSIIATPLVFHFFGALAEFERNLIRERTVAGLDAARARGRLGGRPELEASSTKVAMAKKLYADKTNAIDDICKNLNISRATLYRYVKVE